MQKWIMAFVLGIACILGIGVLFSDITDRQGEVSHEAAAPPELPSVTMNAQAAEATYKQLCIACHGADLEGKMGPNLQKVGNTYSAQQLHTLIMNGKGGMPAFKSTLKDEEIVNIALWLAEKK